MMNCGAPDGFTPHLMMFLKLLDVHTHGVEFTLNYDMVFPVHVPAFSNSVFLMDLTSGPSLVMD